MIPLQNPATAAEYFGRKMAFSTGPIEVSHYVEAGEQMVLVDVRDAEDYKKGHLPGAINLPKEKWTTAPGLRQNVMHILYCYGPTCHLAAQAAHQFALKGFQVMEMDGGFEAWEENDLKVEKGESLVSVA
jgi:rhodanese-related sulfurtransferase